jgi:RNA polymerase sigma-70 factor (sigma-E family)
LQATERTTILRSNKLTRLYEAHVDRAKRLAFLLTGNEQAAEDLVQDAFVRMFRRFKDLRSPDAFSAYLRATIVNLSRDRHRRRKLELIHQSRSQPSTMVETLPDLETRDELWNALHHLPHRQKIAIVLRFYEDLSIKQTAEVMGCSAGAAKSYTSRGLEALRKVMEVTSDA